MDDTASPLNDLIYVESDCGASKIFRRRECGIFGVRAFWFRFAQSAGASER
jgi:hypothetical protein